MRYFLLVLLAIPLVSFGVQCTIEHGVDGYYIHCFDTDPDNPGDDVEYMTKEDCEHIKSLTSDNLTSASELMDIIMGINQSNARSIQRINDANWAILYQAGAIEDDFPLVSSNITTQVNNINNELVLLSGNGSDLYNQCVGIQAALNMAVAEVQGYSCSDQSCSSGSGSGSGSVECPCQQEFNTLIDHANTARSLLAEILPQVVSNASTIARIDVTLRSWDGIFSSITNRLNSPDDRMWNELNTIYEDLYSDLRNTATNQLDLSSTFYSIQQLIRGDLGVPLALSTEGLIGLYGSVFSMVNAAQNSQSFHDFHNAVAYFSNTVSSLFSTYNSVIRPNASYLSSQSGYNYLYRVFTNDTLSARQRFQMLGITGLGAGITNWFQRMELYQQALLGWFDHFPLTDFENDQARLTESSIEDSLRNTTNTFSDVSAASLSLTNNLSALLSGVVGDASSVQIQASLPTLITLFPEFEVGSFGSFGPVQLDTSRFDDVCLTARRITSLVWKVSIWLLYLGVGFGLARLSFMLVLYIINFVKDL